MAHNAGDAISKTAFSICVSPEAEAEIKTCHQGQLNLHELTIKAKNAFEGIYFYVSFRRIPVHSRFFLLNCQSHSEAILQQLNLEIKTLRLSWLSCARKKDSRILYRKVFWLQKLDCIKN